MSRRRSRPTNTRGRLSSAPTCQRPRPGKYRGSNSRGTSCATPGRRSKASSGSVSASEGLKSSVAPYDLARHDHSHDLVRPFENLVDAKIADDLLDAVVREISVAAEHLQRVVGDAKA